LWGNKFCTFIGDIRNKQGPVSHGRVVPVRMNSSAEVANMVEKVTDLIVSHMLEVFSLIDFSIDSTVEQDRLIDEAFMNKTEEQLLEIDEEERSIREFNDFLDKSTPLVGKLRYSLALYQQYPEDYQIQLSEYQYEQEIY